MITIAVAETGMTALHLAVISANDEALAKVVRTKPEVEARDTW